MKIIEIKSLDIPEIKIISFARFIDDRGYFTESFRKSDLLNHPKMDFTGSFEFSQLNECYSKKDVFRGLHFQWNPYMGKMVRVLSGHMVDLALDIRKDSHTYGKIVGYEMFSSQKKKSDECIWVPPGFAHGFFFMKPSRIEYICSGEHNPGCEIAISPFAGDIDWSLCEIRLKKNFDNLVSRGALISEKDKKGLTLKEWYEDGRSENFFCSRLKKI